MNERFIELLKEKQNHVASMNEKELHDFSLKLEETLSVKESSLRNTSFVKKLTHTIGVLGLSLMGLFLVLLLFVYILFKQFTPLLEINESQEHVQVLGGLIDINAQNGKVKIANQYRFVENKFTHEFTGDYEVRDELDELVLSFKTMKLELKNGVSDNLKWDCKLKYPPQEQNVFPQNDAFLMNFKDNEGSCEIIIPSHLKLSIDGLEGQIESDELLNDLSIELKGGLVIYTPHPEGLFKYNLSVDDGRVDKYISSDSSSAKEVTIRLDQGQITKGTY